jgi:hypothetical protein
MSARDIPLQRDSYIPQRPEHGAGEYLSDKYGAVKDKFDIDRESFG